jgi:hypothetical protein
MEYSYTLQEKDYKLFPIFCGMPLCNTCNEKVLNKILEKNPSLLDLLYINDSNKIKVDWNKYWQDFDSNFPRMECRPDSVERYDSFIYMLICLGICSRRRVNVWKITDSSNIRSYLGPLYFIDCNDAIDYITYELLEESFDIKINSSIEYVSKLIPPKRLNTRLEELKKKQQIQ